MVGKKIKRDNGLTTGGDGDGSDSSSYVQEIRSGTWEKARGEAEY